MLRMKFDNEIEHLYLDLIRDRLSILTLILQSCTPVYCKYWLKRYGRSICRRNTKTSRFGVSNSILEPKTTVSGIILHAQNSEKTFLIICFKSTGIY